MCCEQQHSQVPITHHPLSNQNKRWKEQDQYYIKIITLLILTMYHIYAMKFTTGVHKLKFKNNSNHTLS